VARCRIRRSDSQRNRLVEQGKLLGRRRLEYPYPSQQLISSYGRILRAPPFNPVEEGIHWRREVVQLDRSAKGSGPEPQCIPLGPSPGAPFDDHGEAKREKLLRQLPLQGLDLLAPAFVVKVQ